MTPRGTSQINTILQRIEGSGAGIMHTVRDGLVSNLGLGLSVRNIILSVVHGYTGTSEPGSQDGHFEAPMWSAVGPHPPGLSDGYFGHLRCPRDFGLWG